MTSKVLLKGSFDKEKVDAFFAPLSDLLKLKCDQVWLDIEEDGSIKINTINFKDGKNVICMFEYETDLLEGFETTSKCCIGIYDLGEFYNMAKVFTDGFELTFDGARVTISSDEQEFEYWTADEEAFERGPSSFKGNSLTWFSEFDWNPDEFGSFNRAIASLRHPHVVIEGKKGNKTLTLSVTEVGIRTSAFKYEIDVEDPVEDTFKVTLNKEKFSPVVNSSSGNFHIQISNKIVTFNGKSEFFKQKYYIAPVLV